MSKMAAAREVDETGKRWASDIESLGRDVWNIVRWNAKSGRGAGELKALEAILFILHQTARLGASEEGRETNPILDLARIGPKTGRLFKMAADARWAAWRDPPVWRVEAMGEAGRLALGIINYGLNIKNPAVMPGWVELGDHQLVPFLNA